VEFLCGMRAIRRARADLELLQAMAGSFSAAMDELPALIERQRAALKASERDRRAALEELGAARARELFAREPVAAGRRVVTLRGAESLEALRTMAPAATALSQAVLIGTVSSPPSLLLATSEDSGLDAAALLRDVLAAAGGRGGGSPRVAQGTLPDIERLDAAVAELTRRTRG
jgi:alanyl-tRNA synthetase